MDVEPVDPYGDLLDEIVGLLDEGQTRARDAVGVERLRTYHAIGSAIITRQQEQGWGAQVIDRLSSDLRIRFPSNRGLSARNLRYMRDLARSWPELNLATPVAKLPWGHVTDLLGRLEEPSIREWYAAQAATNGWSRGFLQDRIKGQLHRRIGAAPSNFSETLPEHDSPLAQELTRDPLILEFLGLSEPVRERDVEEAMTAHITRTLLELGDGLAFVGRQVPLLVGDQEFFIDLLFFHIPQARYVVVELKHGTFDPRDAGQLNFYVNVVEDQRRDPTRHVATVGLLLCTSHSAPVVRYSLAGITAPLAVAAYTFDALPDDVRQAVPSEADLSHLMHPGEPGE